MTGAAVLTKCWQPETIFCAESFRLFPLPAGTCKPMASIVWVSLENRKYIVSVAALKKNMSEYVNSLS